jgi:long-chain acyl-CoA synthetase
VREFASQAPDDTPVHGNLTDDVVRNAADHPDAVVLSRREAGRWGDVTASELLAQVRALAKGLAATGVEPGDRVALMSATRYEWTLLDYAIWFAGAVSVPVYATSSADQVAWVVQDSGARTLIVETERHRALTDEVEDRLTDLRQVWCIEHGALDVLVDKGAQVHDEEVEERRSRLTASSLATLIYTSGTTGEPKGCMLTHGNFLDELRRATDELDELFEDGAATLLILPLAHVLARVIQLGAIHKRVRLGHSADVARLVADLEEFRPTFLLGVPRVFEKVYNTASQRATADGRGRLFDRAAETAIAYSRALDDGRPGRLLRARHAVYERLVYGGFRDRLGGRCRYAVSGAAPLGEQLGHFYRGIGITVLEGYGLTETTAAVTLNNLEAQKIGTVGRPLGGMAVRVADDGELLVRGAQVFAGYWGDDEATAAVLDDDGWLHTGDLGEIDDEGFVRVIGRKKEILVTAGGKNVAPSTLEDRIRAHPLVSQCLVVGDGRPYIAALITLDAEAVQEWARANGKDADGSEAPQAVVRRLVDDPDLRTALHAAVDEANGAVSQAESIRRFEVLATDWTEEGGQLTPSLKVRRAVVLAQLRDTVDALYA